MDKEDGGHQLSNSQGENLQLLEGTFFAQLDPEEVTNGWEWVGGRYEKQAQGKGGQSTIALFRTIWGCRIAGCKKNE